MLWATGLGLLDWTAPLVPFDTLKYSQDNPHQADRCDTICRTPVLFRSGSWGQAGKTFLLILCLLTHFHLFCSACLNIHNSHLPSPSPPGAAGAVGAQVSLQPVWPREAQALSVPTVRGEGQQWPESLWYLQLTQMFIYSLSIPMDDTPHKQQLWGRDISLLYSPESVSAVNKLLLQIQTPQFWSPEATLRQTALSSEHNHFFCINMYLQAAKGQFQIRWK